MTFQLDKSGINSLAGFAYQIKVFGYYAFDLSEDMQLEFETIEDINFKAFKHEQIDKHSQNFVCKISEGGVNKAIQVKHTSISNAVAQQMLLNWILLESSSYNVENYILFTDKTYQNDGDIFSKDPMTLHKIVVKSNMQKNATISKVKSLYETDYKSFEEVYERIQKKFQFINLEEIDNETDIKASLHFRKAANEIVYYQRMNEFMQHITNRILKAIENKKPYILTYQEFISLVEDISERFTKEISVPSYTNFKKVNSIDLGNSELSSSREFKQLKACELPDYLLKQYLLYGMYYYETTLKYMENNRLNKIKDIEETTFEGFQNVKFNLMKSKNDTPYNRLEETQKYPNSHAQNDQIRYGASIHLTKDDIGENQISWEDDENAQH